MLLKQFNQHRFSMHGVAQKCFQQNDAFRMTEIRHECHRDDYTVCILPFLSLNRCGILCSILLVMRTHVTMRSHANDIPMAEMKDVMLSLSNEGRQLSHLSAVLTEIQQ